MLYLENGDSFAQGACRFIRSDITEHGGLDRIRLFVQLEEIQTRVALDTGGAYLICPPEIAEALELDPAYRLDRVELSIRGQPTQGDLHKVYLHLLADEGQGHSLQVEVTAFVPEHDRGVPTYMGLKGCLENIRFAVDPATDTFYFGDPSVS